MKFSPPLEHGLLVRRYKRFLADVTTDDGALITIHCPNTGSMKHCATPGDEVWYSSSDNEKRKYRHTWEMVRSAEGHYIGVNTGRANGLVRHAIEDGTATSLLGYAEVRPEVKYGSENSRIDLLLSGHATAPDCFVEVKSVTLLEVPLKDGVGYFPDSVSTRGTRHLRELTEVVERGDRAVLVFCVQHSGIREVRPAAHIDPAYAQALTTATAGGVEVVALGASLSPRGIALTKALPVVVRS